MRSMVCLFVHLMGPAGFLEGKGGRAGTFVTMSWRTIWLYSPFSRGMCSVSIFFSFPSLHLAGEKLFGWACLPGLGAGQGQEAFVSPRGRERDRLAWDTYPLGLRFIGRTRDAPSPRPTDLYPPFFLATLPSWDLECPLRLLPWGPHRR